MSPTGASFLFMRMGAPVLGPARLIGCRVFLAALFLAVVGAILRKPLDRRRHAAHDLVLGLFNAALPFLLFAFAARTLSASLLSILNATAPIWGAVIGAACTRTALGVRPLLGLALGVGGVALALGASLSYGIATNYAQSAREVAPFATSRRASRSDGTRWRARWW